VTLSHESDALPFLEVHGVSKTFRAVKALDAVELSVRRGEVHGLVGQNGSGKSTLIKVLSGVYGADAGARLEVDGHALSNPVRPRELREGGLAFVHQDLGLVAEQSIVENMRIGHYRRGRISRRIDWRHERERARETLALLHASFDVDRLVSTLRPGDRALVAIGRALQSVRVGSGCIVFDESTQSLPLESLPDFYATVRRLADAGTSVIIVSHRLDEIMALADRVTVLRDGRVAAGGLQTAELTEQRLASIVLGREVTASGLLERPRTAPGGPPRLSVRDVHGGGLHGFGLDVAEGEVLGVTGASGSGHEAIPYIISGAAPAERGELALDGTTLALPVAGAHTMIARGIALVPEQRALEGLAIELTALENLTLPRVKRRGRVRLSSGWQHDEFQDAVAMLSITPPRPELRLAAFSGGNQQKILLAKWLLNDPRVLVLHEPTQAVDVGARVDILEAIRRVAASGVAVVISSIEPQDLALVCDRVVIVSGGRTAAELRGDDINVPAITSAVYDRALAGVTVGDDA
jgi:ribose transport system ATP-binding protein